MVSEASKAMEYALLDDENREMTARRELEYLLEGINEGRSGLLTADNDVLLSASQTVNELSYDIDDATSKARNACLSGP